MSSLSINVGALNATAQAAVQAMFWGLVAAAVVVPIAAATGSWVAGKIDKNGRQK